MSEEKQMETLIWLGPRQMEIQHTPIPTPHPGEVLIAVKAAGICGSELSGYLGQNSLRKPPLVMGHEAAGRIIQANQATYTDGTIAHAGERVTFNPLIVCGICDRCLAGHINLCRKRQLVGVNLPGAFAQYVAVPARQCFILPDTLSETTASLTEPLACSVRAVKLTQAQPGQSLLIIGAGPIGLFCLLAARAIGIERISVSDLSASRLAVAQACGAWETIHSGEQDLLATLKQTAPGGVDAVIDAVGMDVTRAQAIQAVVPGGQVVFIGLHAETSPLAANYLVRQEISLRGCFAYDEADFAHAFALLSQNIMPAAGSWLEERPLSAGATSFAELVSGQVAATKIVLCVE